MDTSIVDAENIKVPNSVIISEREGTDIDKEVIDFLETHGSTSRVIKLSSLDEYHQNVAIVEFDYGTAIESLEPILPYDLVSSDDSSVVYHIQLLSSVYTTSVSTTMTKTYLAGLKNVARLGGTDFEKVLLEELARIQKAAKESSPDRPAGQSSLATEESPKACAVEDHNQSSSPKPVVRHESDYVPSPLKRGANALCHGDNPTYHLPIDQLSTPEVQRVVVEHVIKGSDMSSQYHSTPRLRPFSGKTPCPSPEVDYDTWRSNTEFYLNDPAVSDSQVVRKMRESLLPPAANIVKDLGPYHKPADYLSLLDSAYGAVEDGDELFAKFLNTNQNAGEKSSAYLQRLQTALVTVVSRGGITANDHNVQLLKQFCRGCWNNNLITSLQLEQKKSQPPSFSKLLLLLRTEEDKQAAKSSRMKQHLGISKTKAQSSAQGTYDFDGDENDGPDTFQDSSTKKMAKQIAALKAQLASLQAPKKENKAKAVTKTVKAKKPQPKDNGDDDLPKYVGKANKKPRPWYCFNCGEDGHISSSCSDEPNPVLVDTKRKELREKQRAWEEQNGSSDNSKNQ